ncbi:MAG TPA: hypothetical protein VMV29_04975 [Ktedonobacterales bacterium]|nr:hypothetical protein [Ktedonobacterales bacterium]
MAINATQAPTGLCRLCEKRPPDTNVYYDEVLDSQTTRTAFSRFRSRYSTRALTSYGAMMICSPCAGQYETSVGVRKNGRRLMNGGLILLVVGVILFAILLEYLSGSPLELVGAAPVLIGIVLMGVGLGLSVTGNRLKQPMTRYLIAQLSKAKQ